VAKALQFFFSKGGKTMSVYFRVEEYHCPQNPAQAVDILSRFGNSARVIAGGTDILPLRPGVKNGIREKIGVSDRF
jgi:hypothetical protein